MSGPVTDTHRLTYKENVNLAVQEKTAQFDDAFMFDPSLSGRQQQMVDVIGAMDARLDAAEAGDTPDVDATHEPVWCRPRRLDWGKVIRKEDQIKALTDYKSSYVQGAAAAMVRGKNAILATSIFADRIIGKDGASTSSWNGKTVAVDYANSSTAIGMTVKKFNAALRCFEENDVNIDEEEIFFALDPLENEQLYNDLQFTSMDFRAKDKPVYEEKRVRRFMNCTIIPTKRLSVYDPDGSTSAAAAWCKRGMWWGNFSPLDIKSSPNPGKQYREHPYMEQWLGATRSEDALVVKILNKTS